VRVSAKRWTTIGLRFCSNVPRHDVEPAAILDTIAAGFIMLRYRAVLFDLDGTLVDSYGALADAVNHARRQHALDELTEGTIRGLVGDGIEKLLQRAFDSEEVPAGARDAFEKRYDEICCAQSRVLDDVQSTLQALEASGVAMAVCTNKPSTFSRKILDFLELSPFFRAIVGPDLTGARKPEAQHVLQTLAATRCRPDEALFVGDMPIDVRAARNSGLHVAVVATGSSTPDALRASHPDHYLDRFSDLVGIVRNGAEA
jgi:phosphoglycolate phosphatase